MSTIHITRKSEILPYFDEYLGSTSDDQDSASVQCTTLGLDVELESRSLTEALETLLSRTPMHKGHVYTVSVHHDCPGCCRERPKKLVDFHIPTQPQEL